MFFRDLTRVLKKAESQSAITIIAGDLNSKVGKRQEPEMRSDGFIEIGDKCLGRYSRNIRNGNGNALIEFCETLPTMPSDIQRGTKQHGLQPGQCKTVG